MIQTAAGELRPTKHQGQWFLDSYGEGVRVLGALPEADLVGKFRTTAGLVLDAAGVARLEKAVRDVATLDDVSELDALMQA